MINAANRREGTQRFGSQAPRPSHQHGRALNPADANLKEEKNAPVKKETVPQPRPMTKSQVWASSGSDSENGSDSSSDSDAKKKPQTLAEKLAFSKSLLASLEKELGKKKKKKSKKERKGKSKKKKGHGGKDKQKSKKKDKKK